MSITEKSVILFSWIGFRDLNYVASVIKNDAFSKRLKEAKKTRPDVSQTSSFSPIFKAIEYLRKENKKLSDVILFFDIDDEILGSQIRGRIENFFSVRCEICYISADEKQVHDYAVLNRKIIQSWKKVTSKFVDAVSYFNLSSGTTAMKTMLIVLGQAKYPDAEFIQTDDEGQKSDIFSLYFNVNDYAINNIFDNVNISAFDSIIGDTEAILRVKKLAAKAGKTDFNVLLCGETGTGKESFARGIHKVSSRAGKPFVALNCATLSSNLAEDRLFGHKKGAYTGADSDGEGIFDKADGGTLFLDEIEACPEDVQALFLRVLQPLAGDPITCRRFIPLGKHAAEKSSDVRIIAATNERLESTGFRSDLLNRLSTLTITLPTLRDRKKDIPKLARLFLEKNKKLLGEKYKDKFFGGSAINFIENFPWPGNVRQLQNAIAQAVVFSDNDEITENDLGGAMSDIEMENFSETVQISENHDDIPTDIKEYLRAENLRLKKHFMDMALKKAGKKKKAAEMLGIPYQTWDNWIKAIERCEKTSKKDDC